MLFQDIYEKYGPDNGAAWFLLAPPDDMDRMVLSEFIYEFGASLDPNFWSTMVLEEAKELAESYEQGDLLNCAKELADLRYVMLGLYTCMTDATSNLVNNREHPLFKNMIEAGEHILPFLNGAGSMYAWEVMDDVFMAIHESNMTKLGDDGRPIRNEAGKLQKGPNYIPPVLDNFFDFNQKKAA